MYIFDMHVDKHFLEKEMSQLKETTWELYSYIKTTKQIIQTSK